MLLGMGEELLQQVKEWAADPTKLPAIFDALHDEAGRVIEGMRVESFDAQAPAYSKEELARRLAGYEALTNGLCRAVATLMYWTDVAGARSISRLVGRLANSARRPAGVPVWLELDRYPALLVLYAAGLGAVTGDREQLLGPLLGGRHSTDQQGRLQPNIRVLYAHNVIGEREARQLPGLEKNKTPASDYLVRLTRPWLAGLEYEDGPFERAFDRFEFLAGLVMYDIGREGQGSWAPVGRFAWRGEYGEKVWAEVAGEVESAGEAWPLLKAGLFGASGERLKESLKGYVAFVNQAAGHFW
jgi:hypothetical protein